MFNIENNSKMISKQERDNYKRQKMSQLKTQIKEERLEFNQHVKNMQEQMSRIMLERDSLQAQ